MLAIGFPLDLGGGPTVTQGIVSGLDRTVHAEDGPDLEGLLQTDAAINPGNSGGALVDSTGKLIGINTIAAKDAENVGFAIAIDGARSVIDRDPAQARRQQAWIGATFDSVEQAAAAVQLGLPPGARGAAVVAVFADSPAAKSGLREGDVVVSVDGSLGGLGRLAGEGAGQPQARRFDRARRRRSVRPATRQDRDRQAAGDAPRRLTPLTRSRSPRHPARPPSAAGLSGPGEAVARGSAPRR